VPGEGCRAASRTRKDGTAPQERSSFSQSPEVQERQYGKITPPPARPLARGLTTSVRSGRFAEAQSQLQFPLSPEEGVADDLPSWHYSIDCTRMTDRETQTQIQTRVRVPPVLLCSDHSYSYSRSHCVADGIRQKRVGMWGGQV
jgi:hypothetical protein